MNKNALLYLPLLPSEWKTTRLVVHDSQPADVPHLAWISMFVLHPKFQGQRIGQEAVAGLADKLCRCGYPAIWLRVYLKNWPALRFWIEAGFTTIARYEGKGSISAGAHLFNTR